MKMAVFATAVTLRLSVQMTILVNTSCLRPVCSHFFKIWPLFLIFLMNVSSKSENDFWKKCLMELSNVQSDRNRHLNVQIR